MKQVARALLGPLLALACSGYAVRPSPFVLEAREEEEQPDLRMGYEILANLLAEQSHLTPNALVRGDLGATRTLGGGLVERLSQISRKRASELAELRKRAPIMIAEPAPDLYGLARHALDDTPGFRAPFDAQSLAVRSRAVRLIAALSRVTARFDSNLERRAWSRELVTEYEGLLGELTAQLQPPNGDG